MGKKTEDFNTEAKKDDKETIYLVFSKKDAEYGFNTVNIKDQNGKDQEVKYTHCLNKKSLNEYYSLNKNIEWAGNTKNIDWQSIKTHGNNNVIVNIGAIRSTPKI